MVEILFKTKKISFLLILFVNLLDNLSFSSLVCIKTGRHFICSY